MRKKADRIRDEILGHKVTFNIKGSTKHNRPVDCQGVVVGVTKDKIRVRMGRGKRVRSFSLQDISGLERTD